MREATPEEFKEMKEQLGEKGKHFKKAYIIDNNDNLRTIKNDETIKPFAIINGYTIRKTGQGNSIGIWSLRDYYLDPGAHFSESFSTTKSHQISGSVSLNIKAVSAELGYGYTSSRTVTQTVGYNNKTNRRVTASVYPIYKRTDYSIYRSNKYIGTGWLNVLNSYAVFTD